MVDITLLCQVVIAEALSHVRAEGGRGLKGARLCSITFSLAGQTVLRELLLCFTVLNCHLTFRDGLHVYSFIIVNSL